MKGSKLCVLLLAAGLGGCATAPQCLHNWDQYQPQLYGYFQGEGNSVEQQIAALEKNEQEARGKGQVLPPGFHAHLGLLYARQGHPDKAASAFKTEKSLYPESAAYMDFLLSDKKGISK